MKWERIAAYFAALFGMLLYSVGITTSQLIGQFLPRLQLNLIRFVSQLLLCSLLVLFLRKNVFRFKTCRHAALAVISGVSYCFSLMTINLAAPYAPLGNLESLSILCFVVPAVLFNVMRCRASWAVVCGALLSFVGVLLLLQPEFIFQNSNNDLKPIAACPCVSSAELPALEQC